MKTIITPAQQRRRYKIHYQLRKKGNNVNVREKTVQRRSKELSIIEEKWCKELIANGIAVCDKMFQEI